MISENASRFQTMTFRKVFTKLPALQDHATHFNRTIKAGFYNTVQLRQGRSGMSELGRVKALPPG